MRRAVVDAFGTLGRPWRGSRAVPILLGWFATYFALKVFRFELFAALWVMLPGLFGLAWIGHAGIVVASTVRLVGRGRPFAALGVVGLSACMILDAYCLVDRQSMLVRFAMLKPSYDEYLAARGRPGTDPGTGTDRPGLRVVAEEGNHLVIFPWPGGILDNWAGVVRDEDNCLRGASRRRGIRPSGQARFHLPRVHDGEVVDVEYLRDGWYFCRFT